MEGEYVVGSGSSLAKSILVIPEQGINGPSDLVQD